MTWRTEAKKKIELGAQTRWSGRQLLIDPSYNDLAKALKLLDECEVAISVLVQMSLADSPVRENCQEHPRCRDLANAVTLLARLRGEG